MLSGNSLSRILGVVGLLTALSFGVLLSGCGSEEEVRPAAWSYIYPAIIQPSCATASCHSNFTNRAGVNFGDIDEAYVQLVCRHFVVQCATPGVMAVDCGMGVPSPAIADPGCPARAADDSTVLHLMRAEGASRMPPDFALPDVDIRLISTWITTGALNN